MVVLSNQMVVSPDGVGWTILQGMPLNLDNVTHMVRDVVGLGIALEIDETTGEVRIKSVYPESPAGKAGLSVGLIIQEINGASVEGKSLQQCLEMIKGPTGESVKLRLVDVRTNTAKDVSLIRNRFITSTGRPIKPNGS